MGAKERNTITESIRRLGGQGEHEIERGEVVSVDQDVYTMSVELSEGVIAHDVRLSAITETYLGMIPIPKEKSHVVIAKLEGGVDYVLLQASELDKWLLKIGSQTLEIDSAGFVFNGGNNSGLVKVVELTGKLNAIENKLNNHLIAYNAHTHIDALTGASATPLPLDPTPLATTVQAQIENTDIKH